MPQNAMRLPVDKKAIPVWRESNTRVFPLTAGAESTAVRRRTRHGARQAPDAARGGTARDPIHAALTRAARRRYHVFHWMNSSSIR